MEEAINQQTAILKNASLLFEKVPSIFGAYTDFMSRMVQENLKMASEAYAKLPNYSTYSPSKAQNDCCPPRKECPPRCLAELRREACPGEVIVVPFTIKNKCNATKNYRVGIRPLVDQNGNQAPSQPSLNVDAVHLEPGQSITVLMTVNLMQGFVAGNDYSTDIVVREQEVNQNICFKLRVKPCTDGVEVFPLDEREYFMHWQSWQDHFYCEQKPNRPTDQTTGRG